MSGQITERDVEKALTQAVKRRGGVAYKFTSPGLSGVPDRLILLPHRPAAFIEVKAPGQKPRPLQQHRIRQIQNLGHKVFVLDHPSQIEGTLDEIQASRLPNPGHTLHP
ncbi:MAG: VRR-NUC domain-containing protein [Actinomycetaceae bacterium]|nr:VRR-NUC domain-containing protein [Actinomycetaceae bacterium]